MRSLLILPIFLICFCSAKAAPKLEVINETHLLDAIKSLPISENLTEKDINLLKSSKLLRPFSYEKNKFPTKALVLSVNYYNGVFIGLEVDPPHLYKAIFKKIGTDISDAELVVLYRLCLSIEYELFKNEKIKKEEKKE